VLQRERRAVPNNSQLKLSRSVSHGRQIVIQNRIETIEIDRLDQIVIDAGAQDGIDAIVLSADNNQSNVNQL
jgi:hypothetical protein